MKNYSIKDIKNKKEIFLIDRGALIALKGGNGLDPEDGEDDTYLF